MVIDELTNNVAETHNRGERRKRRRPGAFSALGTDEMSATEKAGKRKPEWENVTFA